MDLQPIGVPGTPARVPDNPGANPDKYLGTDLPYVAPSGLKILPGVNLRAEKKYAGFFDEIYDQGHMNSCVANASSGAYRFAIKRHVADTKHNHQIIDPSRQFVYYNARRLDEERPIKDSGCQCRDSFHGLEKFGVAEETLWPYVNLRDQTTDKKGKITEKDEDYKAYKNKACGVEPKPDVYKAALKFRIKGYYRLDIDRDPDKQLDDKAKDKDGQIVKDNIMACLSEGHPFIFGYYWSEAKDRQLRSARPNKEYSLASLKYLKKKHVDVPGNVNGHSVLGIGYDKDGVLCQNSWGKGKDANGEAVTGAPTFWVPWEWITDFTATNDFWMIRLAVVE